MRGAEIEPHMIDQQIRRCEKNLDRQVALDALTADCVCRARRPPAVLLAALRAAALAAGLARCCSCRLLRGVKASCILPHIFYFRK